MNFTGLQLMGIFFLLLGLLFFVAPVLLKVIPSIENIPWFIIYVYKRDNFVFVTSPILIFISIMTLLLNYFT